MNTLLNRSLVQSRQFLRSPILRFVIIEQEQVPVLKRYINIKSTANLSRKEREIVR